MNNVGAAGSCGNGWYYDDPANPAQVKLCPQTCQTILGDSGAQIEVDLGCPGGYEPVTFTYEYKATCAEPGTKVQWGFFAYESFTPSDTNVVFKARTAATAAGLAGATWKSLATAKSSPDTQVCPMGGPAPCPIDLYQAFGIPDAQNEHLALSITLNPATNKSTAATVKSWDLTYSCPPSE